MPPKPRREAAHVAAACRKHRQILHIDCTLERDRIISSEGVLVQQLIRSEQERPYSPQAVYADVLLYIAEWRSAASGRTEHVINPATEEEIGRVAVAGAEDLDLALTQAASGFERWRRTAALDRSQLMRRAADLLRERIESIAVTLTLEQGKPLSEARTEVRAAAEIIDWFAEEARRLYGRVIPARTGGVSQTVLREPVGPVVAFTPWNFPITQAVRKLAPALAAGCSIIIKAPSETPGSPAQLVRAFTDAGIPSGVVSYLCGPPQLISSYLISHPIVRKLSFTGSTEVGKKLAALAGAHMKRVTMELGGHAPAIVCHDADLDAAVATLTASKYRNAGQVCVAPTRFLVHRSVYDAFISKLTHAVEAIEVGDGLLESTRMGPLANVRRVERMEALVKDALAQGARLRTGGCRITSKGYFFAPTVLVDAPRHALAMNEEPFGPLALVAPFERIEDALQEANRLPYALASYAFTSNQRTAMTLSAEIQAGMVSINHYGLGLPETPFGGIKDSGYGSEGGAEAMEAYSNTKFVSAAVM